MLIKAYYFVYKFFENILALVRSFKFLTVLNRFRIFQRRNPEDVLRVIRAFILSESPYYANNIKMNRSTSNSAILLSILIDTYLGSHSDKHLEQLLEVLKNEFIKRERE